jgi:hypothetical protein
VRRVLAADIYLPPINYFTIHLCALSDSGGELKLRLMRLPEGLFGYSRWTGDMWSNTLYYSTNDL